MVGHPGCMGMPRAAPSSGAARAVAAPTTRRQKKPQTDNQMTGKWAQEVTWIGRETHRGSDNAQTEGPGPDPETNAMEAQDRDQ